MAHTIPVFQFKDFDIELTLEISHDQLPSSCWELENSLEECLDEHEEQQQQDTTIMPSLCYQIRPDISFLACKRPYVKSRETFLGILEEDENQPRDLPIAMTTWQARKVSNISNNKVKLPNHSWKRQQLQYIATPPPLPHHLAATAKMRRAEALSPQPRHIHWLNFRNIPNKGFLANCGSVTYFLRSILGSTMNHSPWVLSESEQPSTSASVENGDCVVMVFSSLMNELLEYRVSDACPSWSLYSVARLQLDELSCPWDRKIASQQHESNSIAFAYIYRRLPIRERLSSRHPVTNQRAPQASLWETRTIVPEEAASTNKHEENDGDNSYSQPYYDHRLVAPPYVEPCEEWPALAKLVEPHNLTILQTEATRIPQWTAWPEQQHYQMKANNNGDQGAPWHVFPLCHCFPANDISKRQWIPMTTAFCPQTVQLLQSTLGNQLRTALFSRLDPQAVLEAHTGWEDLANHVYRIHVPLSIPEGDLCGTWVDGCVEMHRMGQIQAFDDSKTHRAFNYSPTEDRVVLILDLDRPHDFPRGTATGGHSDELDKFIEQMGGGLR